MWSRRRQFLMTRALSLCAIGGGLWPRRATAQTSAPVFADGFETDLGWVLFEEIVGGSSCYGSGIAIGARSTDVKYCGQYSALVWPNAARSLRSNHVIFAKKVANSGRSGVWIYSVQAYIAPETASTGEVGPEFSMQNTRQVGPNDFRTSTAGIQYLANPFGPRPGSWNIWRDGRWQMLLSQPILPGKWYTITVEANFDTNRYVRFSLRGNGLNLTVPLSGFGIAQESKFNEEAFWLTLESENQYNNCGTTGATEYKMYYDEVKLLPGNGDLNTDGVVDCGDLNLVKTSLGRSCGQPGYNAIADFNSDGVVNVRDLASIAQKVPVGTRCQ